MQNAVTWLFMLKVTYGCALVLMHLASSPSFLSVCISWQSAFVNSHFEDWSVNSKVAEQVKSGGRMTFVAVEAAGHIVHGAHGTVTSSKGDSIIFIALNRLQYLLPST